MMTLEARPDGAKIRLWPAILIAVAGVGAVAGIWYWPEVMRQYRVLGVMATGLVTTLLLFLWLCLFSRLSGRVRLRSFLAGLAFVGLFFACVRIDTVSGDLVPIFAFHWEPKASDLEVESDLAPLPGVGNKTAKQADEVEVEVGSETVSSTLSTLPPNSTNFFGPNRDGRIEDVSIDPNWEVRPPKQIWRIAVGAGWSSFSISGERAYTMEQRGSSETTVCYELATGKPYWSHGDEVIYESVIAGDGPRTTPTVTARHVFTFGSTGILNCLDRFTGQVVWRRDVVSDAKSKDSNAGVPEWGFSSSPLVHSGRVIVSIGARGGQALVAYDEKTGEPVWSGGDDRVGYSSPSLRSVAGTEQVLILNHKTIAGHEPSTGELLWSHPWPGKYPKVAQPMLVGDDRIVVSSGYNVGVELIRVGDEGGKWSTESLWKTRSLKAKFSNFVVLDDHIYGLDDGILVCVDLATGTRQWKGGRYGHGQMLLVGEHLLITSERGHLVLVSPNPEKLRVLADVPTLSGKMWQGPAISGSMLLVRSDREAACYELPLR